MTYQDAVIRDNPVGFWILDSPDIVDDYSSGYFSTSGVRSFNNLTIGAGAVYNDVLPICTGGTNAVRINTGATSKLTISNVYNVFNTNTESSKFCIEFWLAFDNIPNNTNVLSIGSGITFNLSQNAATLSITDSSGFTYSCYLDVDTYLSQMHVAIYYSNRSAYFSVNGVPSTRINMNSASYFSGSSNNFVFGPATSPDYFIIDCIAFYTYLLNAEQINGRIKLALTDRNPESYVIQNNGGYYSGGKEDGKVSQKFLFESNSSWTGGTLKNLIVNGNSLTVRRIAPLSMYNPSTFAINPDYSNGFKINASGDSAQLQSFEQYFNPQEEVITCQVYVTSETSEKPIFSINGLSIGTLALVKPANSLSLKLKASGDSAVNASVGSLTTGTWNNVIISITSGIITLTVNSTSSSNTLTNGNLIMYKSSLFLGNYYDDTSNSPYASSVPVKNFSVFYKDDSRLSDLTNTGNLSIKLISNLNISQYGEWQTILPISSDITINATRLFHDGNSNNIKIYGSTDASTWIQQGTVGEQIPGLAINTTGTSYFLKITMESIESYNVRPQIGRMELITYQTLNSFSHGKVFSIKEYIDGTVTHTYNIKPKNFNLLSRDKNFGIHFEPPTNNSNQVPGMAEVTVGYDYQTIEFWFRVDTNAGATNNYIFDTDNTVNASLIHDASLVLTYTGSDISKVYINGYEYTSGSKTLVLGEIYHAMVVLNTTKTVKIYLNAKHNYSFHAHTTIGDLCIYSDAKNEAFATKKYRLKLGRNYQVITDTQYMLNADSAAVEASRWRIYSAIAD
jgi:hypothetical protein